MCLKVHWNHETPNQSLNCWTLGKRRRLWVILRSHFLAFNSKNLQVFSRRKVQVSVDWSLRPTRRTKVSFRTWFFSKLCCCSHCGWHLRLNFSWLIHKWLPAWEDLPEKRFWKRGDGGIISQEFGEGFFSYRFFDGILSLNLKSLEKKLSYFWTDRRFSVGAGRAPHLFLVKVAMEALDWKFRRFGVSNVAKAGFQSLDVKFMMWKRVPLMKNNQLTLLRKSDEMEVWSSQVKKKNPSIRCTLILIYLSWSQCNSIP